MGPVQVSIDAHGADAEETDLLTRQFRAELLDLDVTAVNLSADGPAPPNAKGDPVAIGTIIVTLANSTVLVGLCQLAKSWVGRGGQRRIVIKDGEHSLELTGGTPEQQQQLIDVFVRQSSSLFISTISPTVCG